MGGMTGLKNPVGYPLISKCNSKCNADQPLSLIVHLSFFY